MSSKAASRTASTVKTTATMKASTQIIMDAAAIQEKRPWEGSQCMEAMQCVFGGSEGVVGTSWRGSS